MRDDKNRLHRAQWCDQDVLAPIPAWPPAHSEGRPSIAIGFGLKCTPHQKRDDADLALKSTEAGVKNQPCTDKSLYVRNLMHNKSNVTNFL